MASWTGSNTVSSTNSMPSANSSLALMNYTAGPRLLRLFLRAGPGTHSNCGAPRHYRPATERPDPHGIVCPERRLACDEFSTTAAFGFFSHLQSGALFQFRRGANPAERIS